MLFPVQVPGLFHGLEIVRKIRPRLVGQRQPKIVAAIVKDHHVGVVIDHRDLQLDNRLPRHTGLDSRVDHFDIPPRILAAQQGLERPGHGSLESAREFHLRSAQHRDAQLPRGLLLRQPVTGGSDAEPVLVGINEDPVLAVRHIRSLPRLPDVALVRVEHHVRIQAVIERQGHAGRATVRKV